MRTVKVLLINYKFKNRIISAGNLGTRLKNYYENNSRGLLKINLTYYTSVIDDNYNKYKLKPWIEWTKKQIPNNFNYYVHFCNPPTSRANGKHCITYASSINTIHEFGHLLGLTHANMASNKKLIRSKDQYDCMTSFTSYPSLNAGHRFLKKWFLENEFLEISENITVKLGRIRNFDDRKTIKILFYKVPAADGIRFKRYFISLVDNKGIDRIAIHTIYGSRDTVLLNQYSVQNNKVYNSKQSGLCFKIIEYDKNKSATLEFLNFEEPEGSEEEPEEIEANEVADECSLEECNEGIEDCADRCDCCNCCNCVDCNDCLECVECGNC